MFALDIQWKLSLTPQHWGGWLIENTKYVLIFNLLFVLQTPTGALARDCRRRTPTTWRCRGGRMKASASWSSPPCHERAPPSAGSSRARRRSAAGSCTWATGSWPLITWTSTTCTTGRLSTSSRTRDIPWSWRWGHRSVSAMQRTEIFFAKKML